MRDRDAGWIEANVAAPRRAGERIFIGGRVLSWDEIDQVRITETSQPSTGLLSVTDIFHDDLDVTERFLTGLPGGASRSGNGAKAAVNRKAVMVIYGHDNEAKDALFDWLRAIGLQPRQWNQLVSASGAASPYIGQVLDRAFEQAQAVIAFFTPDERVTSNDPARAGEGWRLQARPNVLIEAGMALVTHPDRTVLALLGDQELPSDLAGRHYVRIQDTDPSSLHDLATRLQSAGCDTDLTGADWLRPNRFPGRAQAAAGHPGQGTPPPSATSAPPRRGKSPKSGTPTSSGRDRGDMPTAPEASPLRDLLGRLPGPAAQGPSRPDLTGPPSAMPAPVPRAGPAFAPRSQGKHAAFTPAATSGPTAQPTAASDWLPPILSEPQVQDGPAAGPGRQGYGQIPSSSWPEPALPEPQEQGWPAASPGPQEYGRLPGPSGPEPAVPEPAEHDDPGIPVERVRSYPMRRRARR